MNMTNAIKFETALIRGPLKTRSSDWQETAYEWRVTLNGVSFPYFTGSGLVTKAKTVFDKDRPKKPSLDDVLHSLVLDASACDQSFDDWCSDYGYDTDSRKALETYLTCQENATKLRKAGVDIAAERERLQDY
jgi:hypothetical protein